MKAIDYLKAEHQEIRLFTGRIKKECLGMMEGKDLDPSFFERAIYFIRNFADGLHHKKEEDILFSYMLKELGPVAEKLIKSGMLVDHQMARYYVRELENHLKAYKEKKDDLDKLQVLSYAMAYSNLLDSHADREDTVVYPFAENHLSDESKESIEKEFDKRLEEDRDQVAEKEKLLDDLVNS